MHSSVPGHFGCSHAVVLTREAVARMVLFRYLPLGVVLLGVLALGCFALKALPYCSQEWLLAVCVATQSVEGFPFLPSLFTIDCARVSDAWCQPIPASDRFYLHFSPHFP